METCLTLKIMRRTDRKTKEKTKRTMEVEDAMVG